MNSEDPVLIEYAESGKGADREPWAWRAGTPAAKLETATRLLKSMLPEYPKARVWLNGKQIPPPPAVVWSYDDGGLPPTEGPESIRKRFCRAVAIVTGRPWRDIRAVMGENPEGGVGSVMGQLGFNWQPTENGRLHYSQLPRVGSIVLRLEGHFAAYVDGELLDLADCSDNGTRLVRGYYWTRED